MKKIDLGQAISILANAGVIVGIAFLVLEIRQTNAIARVNSYQQTLSEIADWRTIMATDPESTRLYGFYTGQADPVDLDEEGRVKLELLMSNLFGAHETAFYANQYGILGDSEWDRIEQAACLHFRRVERSQIFEINFVSQEYSAYLQSTC